MPEGRMPMGRTPLMLSAMEGQHESIQILLRAKADLSLTDAGGESALTLAAKSNQYDCLLSLVHAVTDPGSQPAGSQPAGSLPAGSQPAGSLPAGSQPAGSQPAGSLPAGSQPAGSWARGMLDSLCLYHPTQKP